MIHVSAPTRRTLTALLLLVASLSARAQAMGDAEIQGAMVDELERLVLHLPDPLPLDADMQAHARALVQEIRPMLAPAVQRWLQETRANLPQESTFSWRQVAVRFNNELVSWLVSSPGEDREATEWRLAQRPALCRERGQVHDPLWALLVERLLFLQPLTGAERLAAIGAERQRFQAWLSGRLTVRSGPVPSPQLQAFQAAERQRAGEPVTSRPMVPSLARTMLSTEAPKPYRGLVEVCALAQWWVANEALQRKLSPAEAMRLFRHGTLPANEDLLLMPGETRRLARDAKPDAYPSIAAFHEATGTTRVAYVLDAAGRLVDVQVTQHRLQVPGLPPGLPPVALEQTMERATFARLRAMRFERPKPDALQGGVLRRVVELTWTLN